jgi:hypothetical protein
VQREKLEREGSKKAVEVKRLVELKKKHIAFHNKYPESHRACAICARAHVSKKHKVRDAVYIPPTSSPYSTVFQEDTSKLQCTPVVLIFKMFKIFSYTGNVYNYSSCFVVKAPKVDEQEIEEIVSEQEKTFSTRLAQVSKWPSFLERNTLLSPTSPNSRTKPFRKSGVKQITSMFNNKESFGAFGNETGASIIKESFRGNSKEPIASDTVVSLPAKRASTILTSNGLDGTHTDSGIGMDKNQLITSMSSPALLSSKILGLDPKKVDLDKEFLPGEQLPAVPNNDDDLFAFLDSTSCNSCNNVGLRLSNLRRRADIYEDLARRMKKSSENWHEKYVKEISNRQTWETLTERNNKLEEDVLKAVSRAVASETQAKESREYARIAQLEQAKAEAALAKAVRYIKTFEGNHPKDALTQALERTKEKVKRNYVHHL